MKRLSIWLTCLLLVFGGQRQGLFADDFNPELPSEPMTKYAVSVSADPAAAAATLTGAGKYANGTEVTISQTPCTGFLFDHWTLNGATHSTEPSLTYTVNGQSVAFVAHYIEYTISPVGVVVSVDNSEAGTVSGTGSYLPGTEVLISVTPNTAQGYAFTHWTKNGVYFGTEPSFTYVVESAPVEFKAFFTYTEFEPETPSEPATKQPLYVSAEPSVGATLIGEGMHSIGSEVTIEAQANPGYRFSHWTLNGQVTNYAASFTYTVGTEPAYFVAVMDYLQTVSVITNPSGIGWTDGSGYYDIGQQVEIYSGADSPYEFDYYTINGFRLDTTQSFIYTVGDSSAFIVANFRNPATEFNPATPAEPIVYVQISATPPDENHYFVSWSDGVTDNPRMVPANKVDEYTPIFEAVDFEISEFATICSNDFYQLGNNRLTVSGVYKATLVSSLGSDSLVTLKLTVNPAYFFSTVETVFYGDPISVEFFGETLTEAGTYKKVFTSSNGCDSVYQMQIVIINKPTVYTITAQSSDPQMGSVTGGGSYNEGSIITLTPVPNDGYRFVKWSDDNTDNPRQVAVIGNAIYTAVFEHIPLPTYTVTVAAEDPSMGTVTGGGTFEEGTVISIEAVPTTGHQFKQWSDGNIDNPRTVTITADINYTAEFELIPPSYVVTVKSSDTEMGTVNGGGSFVVGTIVTIEAIATVGFRFVQWSDGNTDNPREITVTANVTLTAEFEKIPKTKYYDITVKSADYEMGYVRGSDTYKEGEIATIRAIPYDDYVFVSWNDDNTDNPREIKVTKDATYTAYFAKKSQAIDDVSEPSSTQAVKLIKQGQLYILHDDKIYNAKGARIE